MCGSPPTLTVVCTEFMSFMEAKACGDHSRSSQLWFESGSTKPPRSSATNLHVQVSVGGESSALSAQELADIESEKTRRKLKVKAEHVSSRASLGSTYLEGDRAKCSKTGFLPLCKRISPGFLHHGGLRIQEISRLADPSK